MNYLKHWKDSFESCEQTLRAFLNLPDTYQNLEKITLSLVEVLRQNGRIFTMGNGGSHCDAMHFAEELTGRYRKNRRPLGALALGDPSHATCVGNDYGFDFIFSRQLEALARPGDLALVFSTSGNSQNLIQAVQVAGKIPIQSIGFLGRDGGVLKNLCHQFIVVPADTSDRIQEVHIKLVHIAIELMERQLFPENY